MIPFNTFIASLIPAVVDEVGSSSLSEDPAHFPDLHYLHYRSVGILRRSAAERTISVLAIWTVIPGRAVFPLFHDLLIGLLDFFEFRLCLILVRIIDIGIRMIFSAEVVRYAFLSPSSGSITGYSLRHSYGSVIVLDLLLLNYLCQDVDYHSWFYRQWNCRQQYLQRCVYSLLYESFDVTAVYLLHTSE